MDDLHDVQLIRKYSAAILVLLAGALLMLVQPVFEDGQLPHYLIEFAGTVALLSGIAVRLWCALYIGGRKKVTLVTHGPYSLTRNPLYLGTTLCAVGIGLQAGMLSVGIICGLLCWALFWAVVREEEMFMLDRFGTDYAWYCVRTPQFWPDFSLYKDDAESRSFDPASLWRTVRDSSLFILAIPLTELIENLHTSGALPSFASWF